MSAIQLNVIGAKARVSLSHEPTRAVLAEVARTIQRARDDATLHAVQTRQPYQTGRGGGLINAGWQIPTGLDLGVRR